jgi:hypothetical protein
LGSRSTSSYATAAFPASDASVTVAKVSGTALATFEPLLTEIGLRQAENGLVEDFLWLTKKAPLPKKLLPKKKKKNTLPEKERRKSYSAQ